MAPTVSSWRLLPGIVDRPGQTLLAVSGLPRRRWLVPATLAVAALALSAVLTAPLLSLQAQQAMAEALARLPAEQAAAMQQQMALLQSPLLTGATALATGLLALVAGWLIEAAILYFGALIGGSDTDFGHIFAAVPWIGVPYVIETLLQAAYAVTRHQLVQHQGLSYLVATGQAAQDAGNLAYVALGQVSLFRLWHLLLVYVLLRTVARQGRGAALGLTLAYTLLLAGGSLLMVVLSRSLVPSF